MSYIIKKSDDYFITFQNVFTKNGRIQLKPTFGCKMLATIFHSKNDASSIAQRIKGELVPV